MPCKVLPLPWARQGQQVQFSSFASHVRTITHFQLLLQQQRPGDVCYVHTNTGSVEFSSSADFHWKTWIYLKHLLGAYQFGQNLWAGREDTHRDWEITCSTGGLPRMKEAHLGTTQVSALLNSVWGHESDLLVRHILSDRFQDLLHTNRPFTLCRSARISDLIWKGVPVDDFVLPEAHWPEDVFLLTYKEAFNLPAWTGICLTSPTIIKIMCWWTAELAMDYIQYPPQM